MAISIFPQTSAGLSSGDLITEPVFTTLANVSISNQNIYTFSGLSGYSLYRLVFHNWLGASNGQPAIRINSDSGSNYAFLHEGMIANPTSVGIWNSAGYYTYMYTSFSNPTNQYYVGGGKIDIYNANSTSLKHFKTKFIGANQSDRSFYSNGEGYYRGNSPVSSISLLTDSGNFYATDVFLLGAK